MKNYTQFHDGFFEGLRIKDSDSKSVHVYLRATDGTRAIVVLTGVVMLNVNGFKAGNIIMELLTREQNEITFSDISELYDSQPGHQPASWEQELLERARQESLKVLEINPSYGGSCLALAQMIEFLEDHNWALPE